MTNTYRCNSGTTLHRPKAQAGSDDYKSKVAEAIMKAVDTMPREYRDCANEIGYISVWNAYRRGMTPTQITQAARDKTLPYLEID